MYNLAELTQPNYPPRILKVRSIKFIYFLAFPLVMASSLVTLISTGMVTVTGIEAAIGGLILSCYLLAGFMLFGTRPFYEWEIQVYDDRLKLKKSDAEKFIIFSEVKKLNYVQFTKHGYGWFELILKSNEVITFPKGLERPEYLLDALYEYQPQAISLEDFHRFRASAITIDQVYQRIEEKFQHYRTLLFKYLGYPILLWLGLTALLGGFHPEHWDTINKSLNQVSFMFFILEIHLLIGLAMFVLEERIISSKFYKQVKYSENKRRDYLFELKIQSIMTRIYYFFTPSIVAYFLVQYYF